MGIRGGRPLMRGSSRFRPRAPIPGVTPEKTATPTTGPARTGISTQMTPHAVKRRILFVCIGNSCRSQMAEGFARAYGSDVLDIQSAGLSPASIVQPLTAQTMMERNIRLDGQFP